MTFLYQMMPLSIIRWKLSKHICICARWLWTVTLCRPLRKLCLLAWLPIRTLKPYKNIFGFHWSSQLETRRHIWQGTNPRLYVASKKKSTEPALKNSVKHHQKQTGERARQQRQIQQRPRKQIGSRSNKLTKKLKTSFNSNLRAKEEVDQFFLAKGERWSLTYCQRRQVTVPSVCLKNHPS